MNTCRSREDGSLFLFASLLLFSDNGERGREPALADLVIKHVFFARVRGSEDWVVDAFNLSAYSGPCGSGEKKICSSRSDLTQVWFIW